MMWCNSAMVMKSGNDYDGDDDDNDDDGDDDNNNIIMVQVI